jgi:hypothetical protein
MVDPRSRDVECGVNTGSLQNENARTMRVAGAAHFVSDPTGKAQLEVAGRPTFQLNAVAAFIWQHLASNSSADAIIAQLVASFGASEEQARNDVTNFIEILRKHWLVYDEE